MLIVETHVFTRRICALLPDEEYRAFQTQLVQRPDMGNIIPHTGGLRKTRIYFWHITTERLLMLLAYGKNEQDDLTPQQRAALRKVIEAEYP